MKQLLLISTLILATACAGVKSEEEVISEIETLQMNGEYVEMQARYEYLLEHYPESENVASWMFQLAFLSHNSLNDLDKAKKYYTEFIKRFPTHKMVPAAKYELTYLGVPTSELPVIKKITALDSVRSDSTRLSKPKK